MNAQFKPVSHAQVTRARAAQTLLNRRNARKDSIAYAGFMEVPGRPVYVDPVTKEYDPDTELFHPVETGLAEHHILTLSCIKRTVSRRYGRALIMMPPGSAKTTYGSIVAPSHLMGERPGIRIGLGSYGDLLALKMGRRTRSMIQQPRYKSLFNTELTKDSRAGNQFTLTNGSEYMAASISGAFPGNRFEVLIADDPVKGRQEAKSELQRTTTWDEFRDNFMTRVVPGGAIILIMTHWDEEDPAGHILPDGWAGDSGVFIGKHDGLEWEVLCLQARCETTTDPLKRNIGDYLWPQWFDRQHWQQWENDAIAWNSLFQQRPRALEGAYFLLADMLRDGQPIDWPQRVDFVYAVIDSAMKDGKEHDGLAVKYFARCKSGINNNPPLTVLDWELLQIKGALLEDWLPTVFARLEELAELTNARLGVAGTWIEDKSSGTILIQQAKRHDGSDGKPPWVCFAIPQTLTAQGKKGKALNVSGHVAAGMVKWCRYAYEKVMKFKGVTKNHALSQVLKFTPETKDTDPDDCLDTFTYGVALSLGNIKGL